MKSLALALAPVLLFAVDTPKLRLPADVQPLRYELDLSLTPAKDAFDGSVTIDVQIKQRSPVIWLHAQDLKVESATVGGKAVKVIEASPFLGLEPEAAIAPGKTRLEIKYSGQFQKNDVEGLFKQTDGGDSYVLTQFEPTSARRAFPCFDEPAWKTPWRITLRVPKGMEAFANTPVETDETVGTTRVVRFRESKPLPSYLVAMAVGPFEVMDGGTAGRNKTPLRVIATRGHRNEAEYALQVTPKVFKALEDYFGIPYPYEKLDQITIPVTVAFGAMENAGLITYQAPLLLIRPQDDNVARRRLNTQVITHEIAHQWFGNMVTPAWWDDIWLNEAFATWMTERIEEQLFPEWKIDVSAVDEKSRVMTSDSLLSARKIRQPIESEGDIGSAFDNITYRKGSAVIRMFESYVGPELFRKGIRNYMRKHAWGAATAREFLAAITEASGKDVTSAFSTFLDRTGVPLLTVDLNCADKTRPVVNVTQERFLPVGSKGTRNEFWQTPACLEFESNGKIVRQCSVIADPKDTIALKGANACPAWLNANDGGTGYYRVRYEGSGAEKILASVGKLELREKVDLLNNAAALVAAGQMPADQALALVPQFKDASEREIVSALLKISIAVERSVPEQLKPNYARFMTAMFRDRARALGIEPKSGDSDDARLLRPDMVEVAARYGDEQMISSSKEVAGKWLADRNSVNPDIASAALQIAAQHGDRAYFDKLVGALRAASDRRDRAKIVDALGSFRNPELAKAALDLLLDPTLDIRDVSELLYSFNREAETEGLAWPFLVANYDKLLSRLPSRLGNHAGTPLPGAGAAFCDAKGYAEVQSFFGERVKTMPGAERTLAKVLETIQLCGPRRSAQRPGVTKFLESW